MDHYNNKTTVFGACLIVLGFAVGFFPDPLNFITWEPDTLIFSGAGLIFGRSAVEKLINS